MSKALKTITVIGAGGKMGMRISANLQHSAYQVFYCENSPQAQQQVTAQGRELSDAASVVPLSDVVILAVPDIVLGKVSQSVVPQMQSGAVLLTLDPAAAYANLIAQRDGIEYAVAHPCHPSVFLARYTKEEHADAFGGVAAVQHVAAAWESGSAEQKAELSKVISVMYGPVDQVHWVTVTQLAYLEPTLVETVACMVGAFMKEALDETVKHSGVPEEAAKAMLYGHIQIALAVAFRATNPFSDACMIAMEYGREKIIKPDWKQIFDQQELDKVIARMLKIDAIQR
ncbi:MULTISPECIES: phosphogluconate dehydrogenase C-terminal domain-containing protein [Pantoea]|jgi:D-apionate oxidoisomerase|uniref:phosphogluconate dehydrogenase C-terminal domain-containing protein n=1 Tax=Pantoea TaxID=53335 RepID=UPI000B5148A3|nr:MULTISPECIES: phosphogluconate dehydrogenase C-terminal domain-containing protein [Pantoea]MBK4772543.1 oxidoreductase [Pantoea sp. Morm]MBS0895869.1 oxidoreductase [Pantoea dispersa]MCT6592282.1 NAD(P)-binding domain-containing protein [Pantoea dispersa]MCW0320158.1 D-apionate oxidoisomerase [Pantoea dispersa]MCW0324894.1 D-apionate oxidoisomerase [Pantoea dispersa]